MVCLLFSNQPGLSHEDFMCIKAQSSLIKRSWENNLGSGRSLSERCKAHTLWIHLLCKHWFARWFSLLIMNVSDPATSVSWGCFGTCWQPHHTAHPALCMLQSRRLWAPDCSKVVVHDVSLTTKEMGMFSKE